MPQGHRTARFLALAAGMCFVCLTAVGSAQSQTDPAWRPVDPAKAVAAQSGQQSSRRPVRTASAAPAPATSAKAAVNNARATMTPTSVPTTTRTVAKTSVTKVSKTKRKKGAQQAQAEPVAPPRPLTPEQLPPTRPMVSYHNGQLSIVANNSTMADVLNSVRAQTGAQFEMTGISSADRVYAKLGPAAPKDVLAALFDGSRFNYAILGSASDPTAVARVVLMPKAGGGVTASQQPTYPTTPAQPQAQAQEQSDDEGQPEEAPAEEVQPEPAQVQPEQQQQQPQPGQVKTPEQLLQELQQMQQQQQNQQNQQNPNAQPPQQQIPDREIPDDQPPQ